MNTRKKNIELIIKDSKTYAIIIRSKYKPDSTEFITDGKSVQQVGFIVYKSGEEIKRHLHKPLKRTIYNTPETLFVKEGAIEYEIFNNSKKFISKGQLNQGDIIILLDGGHGFKTIKDTVLFEIKQGPFMGDGKDKERF